MQACEFLLRLCDVLAGRVVEDELLELGLGGFGVAHAEADVGPEEKHFIEEGGIRVVVEDALQKIGRLGEILGVHVVPDHAAEGFGGEGAFGIGFVGLAVCLDRGAHAVLQGGGLAEAGLAPLAVGLVGGCGDRFRLFLQRLADAELRLGSRDGIFQLEDAAIDIDGLLELAAIGEAAAEGHQRLVGEDGFRVEAVEGEAGGGGGIEIILQQLALPLELEGGLDEIAGELAAVEDDGIDLVEGFLGAHRGALVEAHVLVDVPEADERLGFHRAFPRLEQLLENDILVCGDAGVHGAGNLDLRLALAGLIAVEMDRIGVADDELVELVAAQDIVGGHRLHAVCEGCELDFPGKGAGADLCALAGLGELHGHAVAVFPDFLFRVLECENIQHLLGRGGVLGLHLVARGDGEGDGFRLRGLVEIRIAEHDHLRLARVGDVGGC